MHGSGPQPAPNRPKEGGGSGEGGGILSEYVNDFIKIAIVNSGIYETTAKEYYAWVGTLSKAAQARLWDAEQKFLKVQKDAQRLEFEEKTGYIIREEDSDGTRREYWVKYGEDFSPPTPEELAEAKSKRALFDAANDSRADAGPGGPVDAATDSGADAGSTLGGPTQSCARPKVDDHGVTICPE